MNFVNLLNIKEVMSQTSFTEDELRDLISKAIFPEHWGVVENEKRWTQDSVRIWLKVNKSV